MRIETEGNSTTNAEVSDVSIIGNLSGTTLLPTPEQSSADTEAVEVTSTTAVPLLYLPTSTGRADSVSPAGTTTSHHGQDEMHFNGSTDRPILSPLVQNITSESILLSYIFHHFACKCSTTLVSIAHAE